MENNLYQEYGSIDWTSDNLYLRNLNDDIKQLRIREYLDIESRAKEENKWLRMDDGTLWLGDPKTWVHMKSPYYKRLKASEVIDRSYLLLDNELDKIRTNLYGNKLVNMYDDAGKVDKFSLVRPFKGKARMSIGNYISVGRDDFLNMYPEFKERYSYVPLTEFMLIKDGNGYRPVHRTGKEADELDRLYREKYLEKGVLPSQTLEEAERNEEEEGIILNKAAIARKKALLNNTLHPVDTPENIDKLKSMSENIIESQSRLGIGHRVDVNAADNRVRKALSLNIPDASDLLDFTRRRLYKNVLPYSYDSTLSRSMSAVVLNRNARIDPYNDARDNIWGLYLRQPDNIRYSLNDPTKGNYLKISQYAPTKTSDKNMIYYDFPVMTQLNPRPKDPSSTKDDELINYLLNSKNGTIIGINEGSRFEKSSPKKAALNYTASKGYDKNKGSYISIYDEWDLEPFSKKSGGLDIVSSIIGAGPVHLYTRLYLDDMFLKNREYLPGDKSYKDYVKVYPNAELGTYWLPQITVNGNK